MRGQAADNPASTQLDKWVGTANRPAEDRLAKDFRWPLPALHPMARGRNQSLGFAGDLTAVPLGNGDEASTPEAAHAGNPPGYTIRNIVPGHEVLQCLDGADRDSLFDGERVHFRPEANRVAQLTFGNVAQPFMLLFENEGASSFADAFGIAFQNRIADLFLC